MNKKQNKFKQFYLLSPFLNEINESSEFDRRILNYNLNDLIKSS